MATTNGPQIPSTPRIIPPSPTTSEGNAYGTDYFESGKRQPVRRSSRISGMHQSPARDPCTNDGHHSDDLRARSQSREADGTRPRRRRPSGLAAVHENATESFSKTMPSSFQKPGASTTHETDMAKSHLSPRSALPASSLSAESSRSPSPLGLIPVHRQWRSFVHRHEIPRKALHVSIGFLTLGLYAAGYQTSRIHPVLLRLLVPIALTDVLRHHWPAFNNGIYIPAMGAFMRESEAHERYNGVIWYLVGTWAVLRFLPKDVGVLSVLLLSWCDTAASTCGRAWGRYTPMIRRGKSVAGSAAAFVVGVAASWFWWGWFAPRYERLGIADNTGPNTFAFRGELSRPGSGSGAITGFLALGVMSLWSGFVASASEAVDIYSWDDNVTIPMLAGIGLWAFLKVFAST